MYIHKHTHTPPQKETPDPLQTQLSIFPQPLEELLDCFLVRLHHFTFPTAVCKMIQIYPHNILPTFVIICLFDYIEYIK